jgi:rfaE bifunctional protein nucleotidyltransferase chain/domain
MSKVDRPKTVLAAGVFDVLHVGHLALLEEAQRLAGPGGWVVVGVNSDRSLGARKPGRPANSLHERVQMLESLRTVDQVISFESDTPGPVIRQVRPDIYLKGGDDHRDTLPEASLLESLGGKVFIFKRVPAKSTTGLRPANQDHASGISILESGSSWVDTTKVFKPAFSYDENFQVVSAPTACERCGKPAMPDRCAVEDVTPRYQQVVSSRPVSSCEECLDYFQRKKKAIGSLMDRLCVIDRDKGMSIEMIESLTEWP